MSVISFEAAASQRGLSRPAANDGEAPVASVHAFSAQTAGLRSLTAASHRAALALMRADGLTDVAHTITHIWPHLLGVDMTAIAIAAANEGMMSSAYGTQRLPGARVAQWGDSAGRWISRDADVADLFGVRPRDLGTALLLPVTLESGLGFGVVGFADVRCRSDMDGTDTEALDFLVTGVSRMLTRCLDATI